MLADKNPYIESAYRKLQIISQDRDKRLEYEAREKAVRDYNEGLLEAEERGIAIGQERGIAIGQEQGIAIGQEQGIAIGQERGRKQEAVSIARKLIGMGYPADEIVKITLLPKEEIERLI